jgi:hypothetical protein
MQRNVACSHQQGASIGEERGLLKTGETILHQLCEKGARFCHVKLCPVGRLSKKSCPHISVTSSSNWYTNAKYDIYNAGKFVLCGHIHTPKRLFGGHWDKNLIFFCLTKIKCYISTFWFLINNEVALGSTRLRWVAISCARLRKAALKC